MTTADLTQHFEPAPSLRPEGARLILDAPPPSTPFRFVWRVARGHFRFWLVALVACETVNASCGILLPYALNRILSAVTRSGGHDERSIWLPVAFFAALCAGELVCGRVSSAIQLRVAPRQRQYVARALFDYLHRQSHRFLTESFAGALAHRISETALGTNQVLWALITEFWPIAIVIFVANVLLCGANAWLGVFTVLWSLGFLACSLVLARRTQPLAFAASSARSRTAGMVVDSVANHSTVRLFARLGHERARLDQAYASELSVVLRANAQMERVRLFQFTASAILKSGVVALAVLLWLRGEISVGSFVMAVSLSLLIIAEVRNLSRRFLELFESLGNVGSGVRAIFEPLELEDRSDAREADIARGAISFDHVGFRYPDGTEVFRDLSVTIPAGQRVGLVGVSGSGKSTFVSLLLRLYDVQSGSIRIDGHEIRGLTQDSLRARIGLIPQDPTLFHRSLRENIRYGAIGASDAEVERAARRSHAHEFIANLPQGYDTQVGERGVKLSGGQRQRIAIARVVLKDAPVLVLDEATASLDSLTERAIQEALDEVMVDKTVIVVAHRLSTIAHLDRILVFAQGRIVEDGNHGELLARGGQYAALWQHREPLTAS